MEIIIIGKDGRERKYTYVNNRWCYFIKKGDEFIRSNYWLEEGCKKPSHLSKDQFNWLMEKLNELNNGQ